MLIRNTEYQVDHARASRLPFGEPHVDCAAREMLLGHFILILMFVIAVLLQAMA